MRNDENSGMTTIEGPITHEDRDYIRSRDPIAALVLDCMIREGKAKVHE